MFTFSLLKKFTEEKSYRGIKEEKLFYSFCDIKGQGEDARLKKKKSASAPEYFWSPEEHCNPSG